MKGTHRQRAQVDLTRSLWEGYTGEALIRRGKTDAEGQGSVAYLSRATVKWLKIWLEHAKITEGARLRPAPAAAPFTEATMGLRKVLNRDDGPSKGA